jgi:hypothetical protein
MPAPGCCSSAQAERNAAKGADFGAIINFGAASESVAPDPSVAQVAIQNSRRANITFTGSILLGVTHFSR